MHVTEMLKKIFKTRQFYISFVYFQVLISKVLNTWNKVFQGTSLSKHLILKFIRSYIFLSCVICVACVIICVALVHNVSISMFLTTPDSQI